MLLPSKTSVTAWSRISLLGKRAVNHGASSGLTIQLAVFIFFDHSANSVAFSAAFSYNLLNRPLDLDDRLHSFLGILLDSQQLLHCHRVRMVRTPLQLKEFGYKAKHIGHAEGRIGSNAAVVHPGNRVRHLEFDSPSPEDLDFRKPFCMCHGIESGLKFFLIKVHVAVGTPFRQFAKLGGRWLGSDAPISPLR